MTWWHWIVVAALPGIFLVTHTLIGVLLIPFYGIDKIRIKAWAIEIVAKTKKQEVKGRPGKFREVTRIWFKPGAQTWGIVIFYAREETSRDGGGWDDPGLRVHERVHILQTILFGAVYPITYLFIFFPILWVMVKLGLGLWERKEGDDDMWHAYRKIPWEIWAYAKQAKFNSGRIQGAWGS